MSSGLKGVKRRWSVKTHILKVYFIQGVPQNMTMVFNIWNNLHTSFVNLLKQANMILEKIITKFLALSKWCRPFYVEFHADFRKLNTTKLYFNSLQHNFKWKDGNAWFTTVPLKPSSDQYCGRYWRFTKCFISTFSWNRRSHLLWNLNRK